ncbi:MAG TPA: hypothetical protein VEB22_09075 [Phycisphaerales bacterium]|nr:hypothetical protein [Phycisphaerales bacterium]
MSMSAMSPNQSPNDGPVAQPISRLDELLADRAVTGIGESEQAELCRLLTAAGKAEDTSLDLAAAACSQGLNPADRAVELPASLLAALDREAEAWCGGMHAHDDDQIAGQIGGGRSRHNPGRGNIVRTPFKRFTREYGGWLAAAACLCFGVYAWNNRTAAPAVVMGPPKPADNTAVASLFAFEGAIERIDRWFNSSKAKLEVVPLGAATPDAGADVAVGQVTWNTDEGSGVLQINGLDNAKVASNHSYRVNVRCPKSGRQVTVETGSVTLHPGQKEVFVPITPMEVVKGSAAFIVSVCSQGPMGVTQSEGVVGFGGAVSEGVQPDAGG